MAHLPLDEVNGVQNERKGETMRFTLTHKREVHFFPEKTAGFFQNDSNNYLNCLMYGNHDLDEYTSSLARISDFRQEFKENKKEFYLSWKLSSAWSILVKLTELEENGVKLVHLVYDDLSYAKEWKRLLNFLITHFKFRRFEKPHPRGAETYIKIVPKKLNPTHVLQRTLEDIEDVLTSDNPEEEIRIIQKVLQQDLKSILNRKENKDDKASDEV